MQQASPGRNCQVTKNELHMLEKIEYSKLSLLVVDDSPINHRVVSLSLKDQFATIDSAYNGMEAFEKYQEKSYDIVLMDSMMPVMNGCEAASAIRLFEKEKGFDKLTKIIAMTASESSDGINSCIESGMDAYLGKPFQVPQFFQILKEIL